MGVVLRPVLAAGIVSALLVIPTAGCGRDDRSPPPPASSIPSAASDGSPCSEGELRKARDDRDVILLSERGSAPGTLYFDTFLLHACDGGWALVEASHSDGPTFNFWLMQQDGPGWHLIAVAGTQASTPPEESLFSVVALAKKGYSAEAITAAIGDTTKTGRPVFD
ncbi:MAG: hypothetical protein FWD11_08900 [Micrococcales bacterium]|nr:hypothetical protein [Micrococcales bacterium]